MNSFSKLFARGIPFLILLLVGHVRAAEVTVGFSSASTPGIIANSYSASGNTLKLSLNFAPPVGTSLMVVRVNSSEFIDGTFSNLAPGQRLEFKVGQATYPFIANYHGGDGNDLVLEAAVSTSYGWGYNTEGQTGDGTTFNSTIAVPLEGATVLAGKTIVSLVAGVQHSLALCADGMLVSWGGNGQGQLGTGDTIRRLVPIDITDKGVLAGRRVVAIAAGGTHSLALCDDGTIAIWGSNSHGQLGNGLAYSSDVPVSVVKTGVLSGKKVIALSAGLYHSMALCSDGSVAAWGDNSVGQLGDGTTVRSNAPVAVTASGALLGKTVTAIGAGRNHGIVRCSDGSMAAWGGGSKYQLGVGTTANSSVPVAIPRTGVLAGKSVSKISAGGDHNLALCSDGTLVSWGDNGYGQLGNGVFSSIPVQVSRTGVLAGKTVTDVSAGSDFGLALCSDGTFARWGFNFTYGGGSPYNNTPVAVDTSALGAGEKVIRLSHGANAKHVIFVSALPVSADSALAGLDLSTGSLDQEFAAGTTSYTAWVPHGTESLTVTPTTANSEAVILVNGTKLASGETSPPIPLSPGNMTLTVRVTAQNGVSSTTYTVTVKDDSTLSALTLSAGKLSPAFAPRTIQYTAFVPTNTEELVLSPVVNDAGATITLNGAPTVSGSPAAPVSLAMGGNLIALQVTALDGNSTTYRVIVFRQVPVSYTFGSSSAIAVTSSAYTASGNTVNLGLNFVPVAGANLRVVNNTGPDPITGMFENLAHGQRIDLTYNGVAYPFVANYFGGTGNDLVLQWANVRLMSWGYNTNYQLGDGTAERRTVPVEVKMTGALKGKTVLSVAAGSEHSLALCSDGTIAGWGDNAYGKLGDNSSSDRIEPVLVDRSTVLADKTVVMIAAGRTHSMALCSDGSIAAWGSNNSGELGNGGSDSSFVPVMVSSSGVLAGKTVVAIAAGGDFSLALCSDGTLASWGSDLKGKLGDGTALVSSSMPVEVDRSGVLAGKTVVSIAAGTNHCLALCSDGTVASWGENGYGQLGNDSLTDSGVPVQVNRSGVLAAKTVVAVSAGEECSLALCSDGSVAGWGDGGNGELGTGGYNYQRRLPVLATRTGVLAGKSIASLNAGGKHILAVCSDGTLAAWGYNNLGQLGIGSTDDGLAPSLVDLSELRAGERLVAARGGAFHSLAMVATPPAPSATTLAATNVLETSATLLGSVNAAGTAANVTFEYGITTTYGSTVSATPSSVTGTTATNVTAPVDGLIPGTTYHYRVVGANANGTSVGGDSSFTTTDVAALAGLDLSTGMLEPAFDRSVTRYLTTVPFTANTLSITPTSADPGSTVTVNGTETASGDTRSVSLNVGNTAINVLVTAPGGVVTRSYTLRVTRLPETFVFNSATDIPVSVAEFAAAGDASTFVLNHTPVPGTSLTVIENTGADPITGTFKNLEQGQTVYLKHGDISYPFAVNYRGGSGNDMVLHWGTTRLMAWGGNGSISSSNRGQLGDGTTKNNGPPVPVIMTGVMAGKTVISHAVGSFHNLVLCADGSMVTWGWNQYGQLGSGNSNTTSSEPVLVDQTGELAGHDVIAIAAGVDHCMALSDDGALFVWGNNWGGQLGNNSTSSSNVPIRIDQNGVLSGREVTRIWAGNNSSFALCSDGALVVWGWNDLGQLGDGTKIRRLLPALMNQSGVLQGKVIKDLAIGGGHVLCWCGDGTLASWGYNAQGQLGDGTTSDSSVPVLVSQAGILAGKTLAGISAGDAFCLVWNTDGSVAAWGRNSNGQLGQQGIGSNFNQSTPMEVIRTGGLEGKSVVWLGGGFDNVLAQSSDGTLAVWGRNPYGVLGTEITTTQSTPVAAVSEPRVSGEVVMALDMGESHGVALVASSPPPTVILDEPTDLTDTSATLNGTASASGTESTVTFEYGLSPKYGTTVAAAPTTVAGNAMTPVSVAISGLLPATTYHYRVVATNGISITRSEDATFTTTGLATLADLTVSAGLLNPGFSVTHPVYAVTVPFSTTSTTLTPVVATAGAAVTVNGSTVESGVSSSPLALAEGVNPFTVVVTSPDVSFTGTYTVNVTRLPQQMVLSSVDDIPLTVSDLVLSEDIVELSMGFKPAVGSNLTLIRNTGLNPIQGAFANLAQGKTIHLDFEGISYPFVVNYFGGSGNDLILQWAGIRVVGWGNNGNGSGVLGNGSSGGSVVPEPTIMDGVMRGKTVTAVAPSSAHSLALCADGTLVSWGNNGEGRLGIGGTTASNEPVLVDQTGVLAGKTVIAIATGYDFNLALCSDGTLASWGSNGQGQLGNGSTTPSDVPVIVDQTGVLVGKTVIAISAGDSHSLALCSDGSLAAWGYNPYGQLGNGSNVNSSVPVLVKQDGVLEGKTIAAIVGGGVHTLVLCTDGTLAAWGRNSSGQLGNGTTIDSRFPVLVKQSGVLAGKSVASIASGESHSLVLCTDGTLVAWGGDDRGQLGDNGTGNFSEPVLVTQSGVISGKTVGEISVRNRHSFALTNDGSLAAWGWNYYGQLGDKTTTDRPAPVLVDSTGLRAGERFVAVRAGSLHGLALVAMPPPPLVETLAASGIADGAATLNGTVNAQGSESAVVFEYGPTTDYGFTVEAAPMTVTGTTRTASTAMLQDLEPGRTYHYRIVASSAGGLVEGEDMTFTTTTLATLSNLTMSGGMLVPDFDPAVSSYALTVPNDVTDMTVVPVAAHEDATITVNGKSLESGATSDPLDLTVGENRIEIQVTAAGGGNSLTYGMVVLRLPAAFAFNSVVDVPLAVDGMFASGEAPPIELNFAPVAGTRLMLVNNEGSQAISGRFDKLAQGQVVSLRHDGIRYPFVVSYFGGTGNDLVLQWANTRMVAWGYNGTGELGDGANSNSSIPVSVVMDGVLAGKTVVSVAAGTASASALCSDGTVAAWGSSSNGALGDGTNVSSSVPVLVDQSGVLAGKLVIAIDSGRAHTLALCEDGSLVAWGYNSLGQLGDGSTTERNTPVRVDQSGVLKDKTVISIYAGYDFSMALCSDGTLAAWGSNSQGQLGDGSTTNRSLPVAVDQSGVLAGRHIISVATGSDHCLALCADGSLMAWGSNNNGAFGNNSNANSHTPVLVEPAGALVGKTISSIVAGPGWSLALCDDGSIAAWGYNGDGELGNDSYVNSNVSVAVVQTGVLSGKTVVGLETGSRGTSLALCDDGTLVAWGMNNFGQIGNDSGSKFSVPVVAGVGALRDGESHMAVAAGLNSTRSLVAMPPPPVASTLAASAVSDSSATLNGSVNAQGGSATLWFEYGRSPAYGRTVGAVPASASGITEGAASATVSGLRSGTTYHYRVVASSPNGVVKGEDQTFTTSGQATLSEIVLSEGILSPAFASSVKGYTVTVSHAVDSITLTPSARFSTATLTVDGTPHLSGVPTAPISLLPGENTIRISVDGGDGINTANYTVGVLRLPEFLTFNVPGDIPLSVSGLSTGGQAVSLALNHAPRPGASLTVVENTGTDPIQGEFAGLADGQRVLLTHNGITYDFIVSYTGGSGNDLVLHWANVRLLGWGSATNGGALGGSVPTPLANEGALAGKLITSISTGGSHGLARCSDGTVVSWGDNNYGQLGTGATGGGVVPVAVDRSGILADKVVIAVATSGAFDLALCSDGTLVAWGYNRDGNLGAGLSAGSSSLPVPVVQHGVLAGKTPVAIATGGAHCLVLCSDGTLASWGKGGTLGNGSSTGSNVPVLVDRSGVLLGKTPIAISAGASHSLVLCSDGSVAAWGLGNSWQLGNGGSVAALSPVLVDSGGVLAGRKVTAIAAGAVHNLALCDDDTLVAWGNGGDGRLGNFSTSGSSTPNAVNTQGPLGSCLVTAIAAGGAHSLAMCDDGSLLAWGDNGFNALGNGNSLDSSVPNPVSAGAMGAADRAVAISAGYYYSAALVASPPSPVIETLAADEILDTGATLRGSVNANGTDVAISFEYGLSTAYGTSVNASPVSASGSLTSSTSALISGLEPGLTYHYRVVATRYDRVTHGEDRTFTTTKLTALTELQLSDGVLSPTFSTIERNYIATVPDAVAELTVTPVAATAGATIRVGGAIVASGVESNVIPMAHGENSVVIVVTSPDGTQARTYSVTVTRLPGRFVFGSPSEVPLTVGNFFATGNAVEFEIDYAPIPGVRLMAVRNTGSHPISGKFSNLDQGQLVYLIHDGKSYPYVADYFAGTGNDLVLHWANNRLMAFGNNQLGRLGDGGSENRSVPVPVTDTGVLNGKVVIDVKGGAEHTVALCSDGMVATWGRNSSGQLGRTGDDSNVPVSVDRTGALAGRRVIAISSGGWHVFALCDDGTLVGWGGNGSGNLGEIGMTSTSVPVVIPMTGALVGRKVQAIAAGRLHSLALCSDGALIGWGYSGDGQVGAGTNSWVPTPTLVDRAGVLANKQIVAVAAGEYHSLALCSDGTLSSWGKNNFGQLGNGGGAASLVPVKVDQSGLLAGKSVSLISCGSSNSTVVCSDGTIASWGHGTSGWLGNGGMVQSQVPVAVNRTGPLAGKNVLDVAMGDGHSLALCDDGSMVSWGSNTVGQLGDGTLTNRNVPVSVDRSPLEEGERFVALAAGYSHSIVVVASPPPPPPVVEIMAATEITGISARLHGIINARKNFTSIVFEFATDESFEFSTLAAAEPAEVSGKLDTPVSAVITGLIPGTHYHFRVAAVEFGDVVFSEEMTFITLSDNALLAGLGNGGGVTAPEIEETRLSYVSSVPFETAAVSVTAITEHPAATLTVNGLPTASGSPSDLVSLVVGENRISVIVTAEDGITRLSYTLTVTRLPEFLVFGDEGQAPVSAHGFSARGVSPELVLGFEPLPGTIIPVIDNTSLEFIHGRFLNLVQGQRVSLRFGSASYEYVANYHGGDGNDLVLQWSMTGVMAWGSNSYGQLGDGSNTRGLSPVGVDRGGLLAGRSVTAISSGYLHSLALCSDGTLAAWGYNVQGQLGDGTSTSSSLLVAVDRSGVLAAREVVAISTGPFHNLALCADGRVVAWGQNTYGQLGSGDTTASNVPVLVKSVGALAGKKVVGVAAGSYSSFARCADGSVVAWGYNEEGELGDGTTSNALEPVAVDDSGVLAGRQVAALAAGQYHTLALCTDGTLVSWGYNNRGQLGNNSELASAVPVAVDAGGVLAGKTVEALTAGGSHSVVLCDDGSLIGWGYNSRGQLGVGAGVRSSVPVVLAAPAMEVTSLASGWNHNLLVLADGSMAGWGENAEGQLGDGSRVNKDGLVPADVGGLEAGSRFMFAASGSASHHSVALLAFPAFEIRSEATWLQSFADGAGDLGGENDDFDRDGIPNIIEYAFGLDPRSNSGGQLPVARSVDGGLEIRFGQPGDVTGIVYAAEWSETLQEGSWQEIPDEGSAGEHVFRLPVGDAGKGFMRLKVMVR